MFKNLGCRLDVIRLMNALSQNTYRHPHMCLNKMTLWNHVANKFPPSFCRTIGLLDDKEWQVFIDVFVFFLRFPPKKQQFNRLKSVTSWHISFLVNLNGWNGWQIWSNLRLELHKVCFNLNSFPYTGALVACIKVEHPVGLGWTSNGFKLNIQWIIIITA